MANFATAVAATVKMPVNLKADGTIAQSGDTVAGTTTFTVPGIKANATLTEANTVFNAIVANIGGGSYDSLKAVKTITVGVTE